MEQLTTEQAIAFAQSGVWKEWNDEQIVRFQLFQNKLCLSFNRFHGALTTVLGRPVYTHEMAEPENLIKEYLGVKPPPTLQDIINMIPEDKRLVIGL